MTGADNFAEILDMLMSAGEGGENGRNNGENNGEGGEGGIFGDVDAETLLKITDIVSRLSESDQNTEFLTALKPLMRAENRPKVDRAINMLRLMSIIPLLQDSGLA